MLLAHAEDSAHVQDSSQPSGLKKSRITIILLVVVVFIVATSIFLLSGLTSNSNQNNVPRNTGSELPGAFVIRKVEPATRFEHIHGLAISPENQSVIYVATHTGLVAGFNKSLFEYDWFYINDERMDITAMLLDIENPRVIYNFGHPTSREETGLRKSLDGGETWELVVSRPDPHEWVQSQSNPNIMYAVDFPTNVLVRTEDKGVSWKILQSPAIVFSIAINPIDPLDILAGTENGLFRSRDGGLSWEPFAERFSGVIVTTVAYDVRNTEIIYVRSFFGLIKSVDGGKSWKDITDGIDIQDVVRYITVDPSNSDVIYIAAQDKIYKSINGGDSWILIREPDS